MKIASPPSCKNPPGRLVEEDSVFESTRTSGVGEYGNGEALITVLVFWFLGFTV